MTTAFDEDAALRELLAPLATVQPAVRRQRRRRPLTVAIAVAVAVLALVGIAAADGLGPFAGIGAADHPSTPNDALDPRLQSMIGRINARGWIGPTGQLVADSVRFVSQLDGGQRIYVISTTTDELCVLIVEHPGVSAGSGMGCGSPLSQVEPTTIASIRDNQQTPPLAFGVARDDVASVSFRAGGEDKSVPVVDNVWAYQGESSILGSLTVHFRDGTETTISR
jgi:hypothetical protein